MKLFINLTAKAFVTSASDATRLGTLTVKQNDTDTLDLVFLEETGTVSAPFNVVSIPAGFTQIRLGARTKSNVVEADLLFSATEFTASGSGDARKYTADLNLETTSIEAKFPDDNTTALSLEALLDVELLSADESTKRTVIDQWPVAVNRDIFRDTEGVPTTANPTLRAVWMPGIDGLTGGGATKLDGLPTEGGARELGALVAVPLGNSITFYKLVANSPTAFSHPTGMRVTPEDQDAEGLNGVWEAQNCGSFYGVDGTIVALRMKDSVDVGFYADATDNTAGVLFGGLATHASAKFLDFTGASNFRFLVSQADGVAFGTGTSLAKLSASGLTAARIYALPDAAGTFALVNAAQSWSAVQTFGDGNMKLAGSSSGTTTLKAPATGGGVATFPAGDGTVAYLPAAGVKSADQTKTSDAVMANDADMAVSLTAGTYRITCIAIYANANSSAQAQGKLNFTGSYSSAVGTLEAGLHTGAGIRGSYPNATDADLFAPTFSNTGQNQWYMVNGILVVTATGTLSWRWAQFASSANSITLKKGSALIAQRIG